MSGIAVLVGAMGLWLIGSTIARGRPDPIREALRGHPLAVRAGDPVDRLLERWDSTVGSRRRQESRAALRLSDRDLRRIRIPTVGAALVAGIGLIIVGGGSTWPLAIVAVPAGLLLADRVLAWRAAEQRQVLAGQVVILAEHLALGTTAGLTAPEALDRSAPHLPSPLREFVGDVVADLRAGSPLQRALAEAVRQMGVPQFGRLCDTVLTAAEQGTPMGPTLMAQVRDIRGRERTRRMERAGRAEIAMLVPIVLLVLPAVVAVAVYPGVEALSRM